MSRWRGVRMVASKPTQVLGHVLRASYLVFRVLFPNQVIREEHQITQWVTHQRLFGDDPSLDALQTPRLFVALKQVEAGRTVKEVARELGVSEATIYTWKSKYGGMEVSEARRLKELEDENRRLKHMVADLSLDKEALKAVIRKNGWSL